jgi:hypothetical protein
MRRENTNHIYILMYIGVEQMATKHCLWLVTLLAEWLYQNSRVFCTPRAKTGGKTNKHFCVSTFKVT